MSVPFYDKLEIIVPAGTAALSVTDNTNSFGLYWSNGTPEASVTAPVGSLCSDYTNGNLYKKSTGVGNTGWSIMASGSGTTDLGITKSSTTNIITSSTGTDATITAANVTNAGLMIPAQFTKLSYITVTQAVDLDSMESDINDLTTLTGVASNATHLGTFTGTTIADSVTVKTALQSLETSVETKLSNSLTSATFFVGNVSNIATGVAMSGDATLANTGAITVVSASATVSGKVELATDVETKAGSDSVRATTPASVDSYFTSLIGNATGVQHLGTFTGTTIADNVTVKVALQSLETSVETKLASSLTSARIFVGNASNIATGVTMSGDVTISNAGVTTIASASTTVQGKVELATDTETKTGSDTARATTPASVDSYFTALIGNASGTQHLGTFTGVTIPDSSTVKAALQALETKTESLVSGLQFVGTWNATTAAPTLGNNEFVRVSVAGTTSITTVNQGAKTDWAVGDFVMKDNTGNIHVIDNTDAPVNLAVGTVTTTTVPITNSLGTGFTIPAATTSLAGALSSTDKTKLDNLGGYQTTYGGSTSNAITHSLGTKNVQVSVYRVSDDVQVYPTIVATSTSVVTITHSIAPSAASFRAVISRTTS